MPHLGTQPPTGFKTTTKQSFSGDNSTVAFTLNRASSSETDLEVFVDNIQQEPTTAYSVSGTTLTFTEAPPTGTNNVYVVNRGGDQNGLLPPQDLGTTDYIFGDDISFNSDGAVINFGADSDINLTHVADTGLTTNGDFSVGDDLKLTSDSAVLSFGADSEVTITHVADTGLNLKHTGTGDDKPIKLTLQTGETDIAADDVLGAIDFQAPDEGTGTDAILVAAGIQAVSEGDFSSSSNATALALKTGASETATEKLRVSSAGRLGLGTSSPDYLVDIEGAVADDAVTALLRISADDPASSGDHAEMRFSLGNGATDTGIRRGHIDVLSNNGTDARNLILNPSGGNIGVGTTPPSTMLDISFSLT